MIHGFLFSHRRYYILSLLTRFFHTSLKCDNCSIYLRTKQMSASVHRTPSSRWKSLLKRFEDTYSDFACLVSEFDQPDEGQEDFAKLLSYNLTGGKRIRGAIVAATVEAFCSEESLTVDCVHRAHLTGWCIEMLHAGFLVLDDIVDNSPTRRGKPSWFSQVRQNVGNGLFAINDGLHLIMTTKYVLHKIFTPTSGCPVGFVKVLQLFDEVGYRTCWGQILDCRNSWIPNSAENGIVPLEKFTPSTFDTITRWKTGFYTFYLPVACGMAIDDFLDCFGDVAVTGKIGTDIADGKCSWLVVECILRASEEERRIIQKCYGRSDEASQSAVRMLYEKLRLPEEFQTYEARAQEEIIQAIETWDVPDTSDSWTPRHLFRLLTDMLFQRSG
ncbi:hypothetical protein EG68_06946 [Paragonimus skrjabini miyazakii]|uniref:Farnesyl pyrophosphate synthase n=1 Tax=Paragonimus skrjabini miyazakii TaxID=59628 RepID=A0A8S9YM28_9TREM|nr:hypothetical protein EG68_06946 [Paragonimus skrjabini miyazakii]